MVELFVIPEPIINDPKITILFPPVKVPVNPVKFKFKVVAPVPKLIVPPPLLLSKITVSEEVGTAAPPEPPEVVLQCVVVDASQVPVPPTQYLVGKIQRLNSFIFTSS